MFRQLINPFTNNKKSLPKSNSNEIETNANTNTDKKHVLSPLLSPSSQPWTSKSYIRFSLLKGNPSKIVAIAKEDTPILTSSTPSFHMQSHTQIQSPLQKSQNNFKHLKHLTEKYNVNLTPPPNLFIKIKTIHTPSEANSSALTKTELDTTLDIKDKDTDTFDDMETLLLPPPSIGLRSKRYSLLDKSMYMYNPDPDHIKSKSSLHTHSNRNSPSYCHSLFDDYININDSPRFVQQKTFLKCADESNDSNRLVWEMPKYIIRYNDPLYEEIMQIVNIIEVDVLEQAQEQSYPRHIKKHIINKSPLARHISYPIMYKYSPSSSSLRHFEIYYEHVKSVINPSESYLRLYSAFIDRFTQMRYPKSSSAAFNALIADWTVCIFKHPDLFNDIYNDIHHASLSIREMNRVYLY